MESRRRSARIQMLEKKASPRTESSSPEEEVDDDSSRKVYKRRKTETAPSYKSKLPNGGSPTSDSISQTAPSSGAGDRLASSSSGACIDGNEKPPSLKVTETIRLFNKHYLHFVQVYQHTTRFL